ncbi:nuclear transport factor 2 family protein [Microbacterium sp. 179-B 1A2 NHS]|uniref:nuclear transport factor 2 family protein n=1 Tax=Microbacterium sp. 179-B 1A2 NHS TaxID=3142383 RepID=UPI00399EFA0A
MTRPLPDPADVLAVSDLKSRYFEYLDAKRWPEMTGIFADDARFEGFAFDADGREDFIATVSSFLADVRSQHFGYLPRFALTPDGAIRGVWRMHDYLTWEPDSRVYKGIAIPGMHGIRGWGTYEEEYAMRDGEWRIVFSRLTRTRIDPLVGPPPSQPPYDVVAPDAGWLES